MLLDNFLHAHIDMPNNNFIYLKSSNKPSYWKKSKMKRDFRDDKEEIVIDN